MIGKDVNTFFFKKNLHSGFTLIELLFIIILLGVLTVMALPQWTATGLDINFEARRILNDLRFTQAMSMATDQHYRWVKTGTNTYQILSESGSALVLPSGSTQVTLSNGAAFGTLTNLPNSLVSFDSKGVPYVDTAASTALSTTATIPITLGSVTRTVSILPQTGYGALQ